jgi:Protein of unknown function (DUF1566)
MKLKLSFSVFLGFALFGNLVHAQQVCRTNLKEDTTTARFTINNNGTVSDKKTNLMWKQCPEGLSGQQCLTGQLQSVNWKTAVENSGKISFAGLGDWRVPNVKELSSIVERRCFRPAINLAVFPATPSNIFWSSTAHFATALAINVHFLNGQDLYDDYEPVLVGISNNEMNSLFNVRLVRTIN